MDYTSRQRSGLDGLLDREQTGVKQSSCMEQSYDQVIATQRQIAGKDYHSIVSGLSKYDFQGTLDGVRTYTKKEQKHLSLEELAELSASLKSQYQTQKSKDGVDKDARRTYRSAIATVNYYLTKKRKEKQVQRLNEAEREGRLSYQSDEADVLFEDPREKVLSADFVRGRSTYDGALDKILLINGRRPALRTKVEELDDIDLCVMAELPPEYSGLSYPLRESFAHRRDDDEVLAADIISERNDPEITVEEGLSTLRASVYDETLQKSLRPRWDTDSFFQ